MRNRWFHAPTLHTPSHGSEKKVSWLELFYDLIFVAAIIHHNTGQPLLHHGIDHSDDGVGMIVIRNDGTGLDHTSTP